MFGKLFNDAFHDFAAFADMSHLAAPKKNGNLNLVIVFKKPDRLLHFEVNIVLTSFGPHSYFFELRLMLLAFGLPFRFVILEFAVIHNTADRRFCVAGNLYKIQPSFFRFFESILGGNNS